MLSSVEHEKSFTTSEPVCVFLIYTVKSDCPMQEYYEIFKDLIQTVG